MLTVLFLVACAETPGPNSANSTTRSAVSGNFGDCSAPVDLRLEAEGRKARLLADVIYIDPAGIHWLAPKGWVVDGASIPRPFWTVIGGPWEGKYRFASVIHDVACDQKRRRWDEAARMFYEAMRCSGVQERKAKVMYFAVFKFGPHWPSPGAPTFRAGPPRSPTDEDVRRIQQFVDKTNPTLRQIETEAITAP
jgi:hypothetical protein